MAKQSATNKEASIFSAKSNWEELIENKDFVKVFLADVLEDYIQKQRWYGGKSSKLKYIDLREYFRIQQHGEIYF